MSNTSFFNSLKGKGWFFFPYIAIFIVCTIYIHLYTKEAIHIAINELNTPAGDVFFKYASYLGEGYVIVPICLILLLIRNRYVLMGAASTLTATLLTQIGKHVVWPDSPRPKVVFKELYDLHVVEGIHLHSSHSFPSGHTTGAFAIFTLLALLSKRPVWMLLCLVAGLLTAYSRMYLSQHFLIDVTVGSLIGTASAVFSYWWLNRYPQAWMDRSIICRKNA